MDRVMSQEERIRRAEEIYYRRRAQGVRVSTNSVNVGKGNKILLGRKMLIQLAVCILIYSGLVMIKGYNNVFSDDVITQTRQILSYDINFQEMYNQCVEYFSNNFNNITVWNSTKDGEDISGNSESNDNKDVTGESTPNGDGNNDGKESGIDEANNTEASANGENETNKLDGQNNEDQADMVNDGINQTQSNTTSVQNEQNQTNTANNSNDTNQSNESSSANENNPSNISNNENYSETNNSNSEGKVQENNNQASTPDGTIKAKSDSENMDQMHADAEYIQQNYSLIHPVEGIITSKFGSREETDIISAFHQGVDIGAASGTPIHAAMEGTVVASSYAGDYGNHIKIQNGDILTVYAHCSTLDTKVGDYVTQGQVIGKVGATGKVTGPHLHFEFRREGRYVDPELIMNF